MFSVLRTTKVFSRVAVPFCIPTIPNQSSWPPSSVETDQRPDRKFRQGSTGSLLQQEWREYRKQVLLLAPGVRGELVPTSGGGGSGSRVQDGAWLK